MLKLSLVSNFSGGDLSFEPLSRVNCVLCGLPADHQRLRDSYPHSYHRADSRERFWDRPPTDPWVLVSEVQSLDYRQCYQQKGSHSEPHREEPLAGLPPCTPPVRRFHLVTHARNVARESPRERRLAPEVTQAMPDGGSFPSTDAQYASAMSLALRLQVKTKFDDAMKHCDNLVEVHRQVGSSGRGRRIETSVNRAVVVMAVASWQAVVEDMTMFMLDRGIPDPSDPNYAFARLVRGQVMGSVTRFTTPNARNSRVLLQQVGFDPRPHWTWSVRESGGRQVTLKPAQVEQRLGDWLQVRHAIAHGDTMPDVDVLQAVRLNVVKRQRTLTVGGPTIRLVDAQQCIAFIRKLTEVTLVGLSRELRTER